MCDDVSDHKFPESVDDFSYKNYLCCFGHVHIKTGARIVAYFELVAWTSLLSYLLADYMVYGYTSTIRYGLIAVIIQAFFVFSLFYAINSERRKFLVPNLVALCFIIICLLLHVIAVLYACLDKYPNLNKLRKTAIPRIVLCIIGTILICASVRILFRCHRYFTDLETLRSQSSTGLISMCSGRSMQPPISLNVEDLNRVLSREERKTDFGHRQSIYYEAAEDLDNRSDVGTSNSDENSVANSDFPNPIPVIVVNGINVDWFVF